jgi:hypothetical protein
MLFFTLLPCNAEQNGERTVPASRRPRMVARPGGDQRHLAWARPAMAPSPRVLLAMAVSGRWTMGRGASEVEVFLAADQTSGPHGGATAADKRLQSPSPRATTPVDRQVCCPRRAAPTAEKASEGRAMRWRCLWRSVLGVESVALFFLENVYMP